jgi:hypothetical protein
VGAEIQLHALLIPALIRGAWSATRYGHLAPEEKPLLLIKKDDEWILQPAWKLGSRGNDCSLQTRYFNKAVENRPMD